MDFLPIPDDGHLEFTVKAGPGTSLATTDGLFRGVEAVVREEVPEAEVVVSQFGGRDAFSALFGQNSYTGSVQLRLPPRSTRSRSKRDIEARLLERFEDLSGVDIQPQAFGLAGAGGDLVVKILADDLARARAYGDRLKSRLERVPGAASVVFSMELGRPELQVQLDREQIRVLGLTPAGVSTTISTYFLGTTATMYRDGGDEHAIKVRAPREVREDIRRLRALPVVTPRGLTVPLDTVADIDSGRGPTAITRENQRRVATIAVTAGGVPLGTLMERVNGAIAELGSEPGITTAVAGSAEDLRESFMALALAFLVAVVLVYMVMAAEFESLLEPFVILFSIPLALVGVVLALKLTGATIQVTALIGIILLAGVVVNNAIVLIDVVKHRRAEKMDLILAAQDAARSRLRPILMTSLTTILGMVPLAFEWGDGAEMWAPMARAVIGGMVVSTALTLIVVPAGYVSLAGWSDRRRQRRAARRAAAEKSADVPAPVPAS